MKKKILTALFVSSILFASSCATIFGGKITDCQRTKPGPGGMQRQVRIVPLIADIIIFAPSLIVDFADGAIYKPCNGTAYMMLKNPYKDPAKVQAVVDAPAKH